MTKISEETIPGDVRPEMSEFDRQYKEERIRLETAHDNYLNAVGNDENRCTPDHVALARRLWKAAGESDYPSIPGIVDAVTVPEGRSLLVRECRETSFGDESELYVMDSDGQKHETIFDYLGVDDTPMGALPSPLVAFQLRTKGMCLFEGGPGRDHAWQGEAFLEDEAYDVAAGE